MAPEFPDLVARFRYAIVEYERTLAEAGRADGPTEEDLQQLRCDYLDAEAAAAQHTPPFSVIEAVTSIPAALDRMGKGDTTRLVARVSSIGAVEMWPNGVQHRQGAILVLRDQASTVVETPLLFSSSVLATARAALHQGTPVEAFGSLAVVPRGKNSVPLFMVHRLRPLTSALAAIGATKTGIDNAEAIIAQQSALPSSLPQWIVRELRRVHGVVAKGLSQEFLLAETAVVLQAASTGQLPNANPRIHDLIVGQPGSGKKIIALYVRTLEPVCLAAQASTLRRGARITYQSPS